MPLVQVLSARYRVAIWVGSALAAAGLTSFAAYALAGLGRGSLDNLFLLWVNSGISFAAAAVCAARGLAIRHERRAWTLLGFAIASSATGDLIYACLYNGVKNPPFPTIAAASYLAFYPACYGALLLLLRGSVRSLHTGRWTAAV